MTVQHTEPPDASAWSAWPTHWRKVPLWMTGLYAIALWALGLIGLLPARFATLSLTDLGDLDRLSGYLAASALAAFVNMAVFIVLGGLATALPAKSHGLRWLAQMFLCGAIVSALVTGIALLCAAQAWPESIDAAAPLLGCALGVWVVGFWRYGFWARLSLVPQALVISLSLVALLYASLSADPLPLAATEISSAEKRRLVELVRNTDVEARGDDLVRTLQLSQRDVNLLTNWGLQVAHGRQTPSKSVLRLADDELAIQASLLLHQAGDRYLNVTAAGAAGVDSGRLDLQLRRLRVGQIEIPAVLLPLVSQLLTSYVRSEPDLDRVVSRTPLIQIESSGVTVVLEKGAFTESALATLEPLDPRLREATVAQLQYLQRQLDPHNPAHRRFEGYVEASFNLAAQRTTAGRSAAQENRAAIFALGILLGHARLGKLILGAEFDDGSYAAAAAHVGRVPLSGRRDWTRHFIVSAALTIYANSFVSDAAGLLKEELDAGDGGSGFSFGDLAADRAGTRFALAATRDEAAARDFQQQMLRPWNPEDVFPLASDLPEGLTDEELEQQFGGVGGAAYQSLIGEIERRLDDCRLLQ